MTAVIQPNDEVCASSKYIYEPLLLFAQRTYPESCVTAIPRISVTSLTSSAFQS